MISYNTDNDSEWVSLLKEGKQSAYLKIYDHYSPALLNYAASRLTDVDDAADLVHDVFLKLWTSRTEVKNIKAYLYALLRNQLIDFVRRNATRTVYANMLQALAAEPEYNMEQELDARELQRIVDKAIEQLPDKTKIIYKLSRSENRSIPQIALLLGISEQTVKNQLSNAKILLRKATQGTSLLVILYLFY